MDRTSFRQGIFSIRDEGEFNRLALEIFHYQYDNNAIYRKFLTLLGKEKQDVNFTEQIPFLPIEFFRSHKIVAGGYPEEVIFESSGTTSENTSRHYVVDFSLYEKSFSAGFSHFFGDIGQYCLFALLPSYHQRQHSSLIYMVERLLLKSNRRFGGFYLENQSELRQALKQAEQAGLKILLIGVTYALLGMVEEAPMPLPEAIIVETGGMKGRRKEITREELHHRLKEGFHTDTIYSEYGMTELLSQAWSKGEGIFRCPPWMRVYMRDTEDPMSHVDYGTTGGINIIDLANFNSCPFIATQDLGKLYPDGSFEVLGRFDNSDIRGCSLLV